LTPSSPTSTSPLHHIGILDSGTKGDPAAQGVAHHVGTRQAKLPGQRGYVVGHQLMATRTIVISRAAMRL